MDWRAIRLFGSLIWPAGNLRLKLRFFAAVGCTLAGTLVGVMVPWQLKRIVDALATQQALLVAVPLFLIVSYPLLRFIGTVGIQGYGIFSAEVVQTAKRDLSTRLIRHLHTLDASFHMSRQTGSLAVMVERGCMALEKLSTLLVAHLVPTLIQCAIVSVIFLNVATWQVGVSLIGVLVSYAVLSVIITDWQTKIRFRVNRANDMAGALALDGLINHEAIELFCGKDREVARYDNAKRDVVSVAVRDQYLVSLLSIVWALLNLIAVGSILTLTAAQVVAGTMTVGSFVMLDAYLLQLLAPLGILGLLYRDSRQSMVDLHDAASLLKAKPTVTDGASTYPEDTPPASIVFEGVSFAYPGGETVLHNVSFKVPAGRSLAIVGPSGAGKSTIMRLLCRQYDVQAGSIRLDETDIRDLKLDALRSLLGVVPQDVVLFNESARFNLVHAKPNASADDIARAAKLASIEHLLSEPSADEARLGERGGRISGGERQRLAIARVLLKMPPIIIMDEATSSLDQITEKAIQGKLAPDFARRTRILIAHRLSTTMHADSIVVLDKGRVVEQGDHELLLARNGLYARLWFSQFAVSDIVGADASSSGQEIEFAKAGA